MLINVAVVKITQSTAVAASINIMKTAFIFPGQGSQFVGMGEELYNNFSIAKDIFNEASSILKVDMTNLLFSENELLNQTQWTQSAILLNSYVAYKIFASKCDIKPIFALGHSLGEISANLISGSINFQSALKLVHKRGELMQQACDKIEAGMAVIIGVDDEKLIEFCNKKEQIWCANFNADGQIVLAGSKNALAQSEQELKNLGAKRVLMLPMSVASHCPLLSEIVDEFRSVVESKLMDNFTFEIISNATMEAYSTKERALELLSQQLVKPVFYKQSIQKNESRIEAFIEFGGSVLKGLNKRLSKNPTHSIVDIASLEATLNAIGAK